MADYRDIMLSEPPQHTSGGGAYSGYRGTFENYKGILLCDRPTDQKVVGPHQPFLPPGAVEGALGIQPSNEELHRHDQARKNLAKKKVRSTAQQQHRKNLKALNELKVREKLSAVERAIEEEGWKERFKDKQSRLRKAVINQTDPHQLAGTLSGQDPHTVLGTFKNAADNVYDWADNSLPPIPNPPTPLVATPPSEHSSTRTPRAAQYTAPKKKEKPKWAMTEEEAFAKEMKDTDDLVRFAESLDFEKYLDDYEIREALSIMRERVEELKGEELHEVERKRRLYHQGIVGDEVSGIYDDSSGDPLGIRVTVKDGVMHATHETASWSPASGGRVSGNQIQNMPLGSDTLSAIVGNGTISWNNGSLWIRREERIHNLGADPFALNKRNAEQRDDDNISTFSTLSERKKRLISDEAMALAEKILQSSSSLRAVHSKTSLGRILEELTHKAYNQEHQKAAAVKKPMETTGQYVAPPQVAIHQPKSTADPPRVLVQLKKSQDYVQNLPYMYRCPSI